MYRKYCLFCSFLSSFMTMLSLQGAAQQREQLSLSNHAWNITLDKQAHWEDDTLYLPPVNIAQLPVNNPTEGWSLLDAPDKRGVRIPATVEGELWNRRGDGFGVNGNYVGVSWFVTEARVPASWQGKHVLLRVGSVRFRAEVFINRKLAGYDLVNGTPFDIDITSFVKFGQANEIAFRITDPNGNFNWKDSQVYAWGKYLTNPSHGFGGITGEVKLEASDPVYIDDVFVQNMPDPRQVEIKVAICNSGKVNASRTLDIVVVEDKTNKIVFEQRMPVQHLREGISDFTRRIKVEKARLWSIESPALYKVKVRLGADESEKRFGFRWFEIRDVKGDRQFYLNGKRIVLRTAISWSFWPENGIAPGNEMARKQVETAKNLGLNMLNFHRAVSQPAVLDYADELGLLYYEEPGGNQYPANRFNDNNLQSKFYFAYRNEKLTRMIVRDRSHPSLIIYNMHNERGAYPQAEDYRQMRLGHTLDPSRLMTYNSSNGDNPVERPDARFKLHLEARDTSFRDYGWYDRHHAGGPGVYHDNLYVGKDNYHRFSDHKNEIIFYGEDGAIGTPPRLQLIREAILKNKSTPGWEGADYLAWYDSYARFLKEYKFDKAFTSVDQLTKAMGNVAYYYQGRIIENIRMNNIVDGYAINGWESMKLENHSGVVDNYRNPKGDPDLIARYNKPLYLAVKLNRKVLATEDTATVDVYIVNERNIKGNYVLRLKALDSQGRNISSKEDRVNVAGGNTYGQPLSYGWKLVVPSAGYIRIEAQLLERGRLVTNGSDSIFSVKLDKSGILDQGSVADTTGTLQRFMKTAGLRYKIYTGGKPQGDYLLAGAFEPQQWGSGMSDLIEWVHQGHTLIIVDNVERWAEFLADKEVLDYRGAKPLGRSWYGGNFFNREHPVFAGLPVNCVFNWEYQCFAAYNRRRIGLRIVNGETLVGCVSDHKKEVFSALSVIPVGNGKIVISSLDIPSCLKANGKLTAVDTDGMNESMNTFNTSGGNRANVVGQQLLLNMLKL